MPVLKIKTEEDLYSAITRAFEDASFLDDTNIEVSPLLTKLNFHLEGRYDSTITPTIMRSILSIQDSIYELYSVQKYGEKKRLSSEERESIDLVASVKAGSTSVEVFIEKALEVLSTMTGEQALAGIGILCGTFLVGSLGKRAFDYFEKIKETQTRAAETSGNQQLFAKAFETSLEGQREFLRTITREPYQALSVNGSSLNHDEIKAMTSTPRIKKEEADEVYSGEFRITDIHIADDGTFIDAVFMKNQLPIQNINILADYIPAGDYQWIKDAVDKGKGKPIMMTVVAHVKGGIIEHAYLQSFDKKTKTTTPQKKRK